MSNAKWCDIPRIFHILLKKKCNTVQSFPTKFHEHVKLFFLTNKIIRYCKLSIEPLNWSVRLRFCFLLCIFWVIRYLQEQHIWSSCLKISDFNLLYEYIFLHTWENNHKNESSKGSLPNLSLFEANISSCKDKVSYSFFLLTSGEWNRERERDHAKY